ncbi:MAG: hypothetical protein WCS42_16475, partial [Verrucomicrobiota bacterium]
MTEKSSGSGVPFNLTTIIALLTLVGGLFIASRQVSSDRPVSPAESGAISFNDQQVPARLWEDPLCWTT